MLGLMGAGIAVAPDAHAGDRCTTKPAVCARLKAQAQQAGEASPAAPKARVESGDRCTSKPAVCVRLKAEKAQLTAAAQAAPAEVSKSRAAPLRCTSKPAVCMRQNRGR